MMSQSCGHVTVRDAEPHITTIIVEVRREEGRDIGKGEGGMIVISFFFLPFPSHHGLPGGNIKGLDVVHYCLATKCVDSIYIVPWLSEKN